MTEQDAKKKWCPHTRSVPDAQGYSAGNRFDKTMKSPLDDQCKCIASDCMMWKWDLDYGDPDLLALGRQSVSVPKESTTEGHCGLAK